MEKFVIADLKRRDDLDYDESEYVAQLLVSKGYKGAKNDPSGIGTMLEVSTRLQLHGWKEAAADSIGWHVYMILYPTEER